MADDQTFRLILAVGMVAFLPVALYHRIQSQASGERLALAQGSRLAVYAAMSTMSATVRFATAASIRSDQAPLRTPVWKS